MSSPFEDTRLMILRRSVADRKGRSSNSFADFARAGFARLRVDGQIFEIGLPPNLLQDRRNHSVDVSATA
nr:hypothetical protein [Candidatus Accumulibacter sp. ACC012]